MEVGDQFDLLDRGGVMIWVIAALSLVAVTIIVWKVLRLIRLGAWGGGRAETAVEAFQVSGAIPTGKGGGIRMKLVRSAISSIGDPAMDDVAAREETERVARRALAEARSGLRALDVIATVAPLLGLLGTVIGMIDAFQALQDSGARADPAALAGGIWQALLTTAAGMGVAIPAALALAWFESVVDAIAVDMEDLSTRVFLAASRRARGEAI